MHIGPIEVSAYVGRTGADASLYVRRAPHPEWGFSRQSCVVAVWYARRCDAGFRLFGFERRWRL